jgi:hypothetical protein
MVLSKLITELDIYAQPITLNFAGKPKIKSLAGGVMTLVLLCVLCFLTFIEMKDFFFFDSPRVSVFTSYSKVYDQVLDNYSMPLAIFVEDEDGRILPDTDIFKFEAYVVTKIIKPSDSGDENKLQDISYSSVNLLKCTKDHFTRFSQQTFNNEKISEMLCIEDQKINLLEIDDILKYFIFRIKLNENNQNNLDVGKYKINTGKIKLKILFQHQCFNDSSFTSEEETMSIHPQYISRILKSLSTKQLEIYFRSEQYNFYDIFMSSLFISRNSLTCDRWSHDEADYSDGVLAEIKIFPEKLTKVTRIFPKSLPILISDIGGSYIVLYYIFKIFIICISKMVKDQAIVNSVFYFAKPEVSTLSHTRSRLPLITSRKIKVFDLGSDHRQTQSKNIKLNLRYGNQEENSKNFHDEDGYKEVYKNSDLKNPKPENNNKNENNEKNEKFGFSCSTSKKEYVTNGMPINNFFKAKIMTKEVDESRKETHAKFISDLMVDKSKNKKLEFSIVEIVKMVLFSCLKNQTFEKKRDLFDKAKIQISKILNVTQFIFKMDEIEKLKSLVLNPEQNAIFEYISKDKQVKQEDEKEKFSDAKEFFTNKETLARLITQLRDRLDNKKGQIELDKRLYDLLSEEMKKSF